MRNVRSGEYMEIKPAPGGCRGPWQRDSSSSTSIAWVVGHVEVQGTELHKLHSGC